jgi:hypothetical protein
VGPTDSPEVKEIVDDVAKAWSKVLAMHEGRKEPEKHSAAQELLEAWWNEDPEMRYAEILCGRDLRCCVRLYQISFDAKAVGCGPDGEIRVGEGESAVLEDAIRLAVHMAGMPQVGDYRRDAARRKASDPKSRKP